MRPISSERRMGDAIPIAGNYQHRALHSGNAVQRAWHKSKLLAIDALLQPRPSEKILDIGCGSGVCTGYLADQGCEAIGIDANAEAIRFASETYGPAGARFQQGYVDDVELPSGFLDGAICLEVVEHLHLPQVDAMLQSVARAMRPGGRLFLTTPNYRSLWPVIEFSLDALRLVPKLQGEQHVSQFTHERLRLAAERAGFGLEAARSICTIGPWIAPLSESLFLKATKRELSRTWRYGTILAHLYVKR